MSDFTVYRTEDDVPLVFATKYGPINNAFRIADLDRRVKRIERLLGFGNMTEASSSCNQSEPTATETELRRQLDLACQWGAALWNTLDHGGKTPADFRENYVEGSRTIAVIDADTGERWDSE